MIETIISDSEILEYAMILLLLSPIVFTILYLMIQYPRVYTNRHIRKKRR